MSFTPGPWKLETAPGGANDGWQISSENTSCGKGRYVVLASRSPITGEEFAGNARLIAAAPELVDKFREALRIITTQTPQHKINEFLKGAAELLRRIKGEEETK